MINSINRCKALLGTYVDVQIKGDLEDNELLDISSNVFDRIEKIQDLLSFHDENSELSYINSNAYYHSCKISKEMRDVLEVAIELGDLTDGMYDITIASELVKNGFLPDLSFRSDDDASYKNIKIEGNQVRFTKRLQIDLGGIAKGYAVDQGLMEVGDRDVKVVINAGGDIASNNWQSEEVDIRSPKLNEVDLKRIKMKNKAVATSASYYFNDNKNPIISPKSKEMIDDRRSVSVFAPNCMIADALTKVAFLDGNAPRLMEMFKAKALFINENGEFC